MKKSDLYREWARVMDMCDGTKVAPKVCWKLCGTQKDFEPEFSNSAENYEFAVAILENKPVFVGDIIYHKGRGSSHIVSDGYHIDKICLREYTWNPPKKTVTLNGVELPMHCGITYGRVDIQDTYVLQISNSTFHYRSAKERDKVSDSIIAILSGNAQ